MALSKNNFYSGCSIMKDYTLDNYVKGLYYDKKLGRKTPIPEGINKYNKQFILQLNDLNMQFFGLLRADSALVKLLKMHEHTSYGDLNILYNLMRAQGGTIRYNKLLKSALKKYAIQKQAIYDSIKKDLSTQEDRVVRNKKLINDIMSDFGLDCLKEFIQETTGRDIVDDILQFALDNDKDINFKGQTDTDEETQKKEIQSYYDSLDNEYINYLLSNARNNGVELFKTISDSLEQHHNRQEQKTLERKQKEKEYKQQVKQNRALTAINNDNCKLNIAINANDKLSDYARDGINYKLENRIGMRDAIALQKLINNLGGIGYYIAICKESKVYYAKETNELTASILRTRWFSSLEQAQTALDELEKAENDYCIKIQKLQTVVKKTETLNELDRVKVAIDKQLAYHSDGTVLCNRILNKCLVDTLKYELEHNLDSMRNLSTYIAEPCMKMVAFYKINNKQDIEVKYLLDFSLSEEIHSKCVDIKYKDCNGDIVTINASIGADISKIVFMSILEDNLGNRLESTLNKSSLEQLAESIGQYNVITYSYKFNFGTYLEFMYNTHTKYMNKIRQYFQTRPSDLKPNECIEHYIQSQQTHTILLKKLKDFRDKEGLQHLYIILAGHDESKIMSVGIKGNTDLTLRKYISQKTKFFISYNEAMKAVINLVRNSDTELYTVHEIDLSTIAI